ncbi:MAG: phenylalanine--tRNA ligase subunit beta [Sphingomonas sp.]
MKFTLSWLKEHLETEASLDEIVETLTRIGLEVEGVENAADKLAPFIVAEVLTAAPHPQADKLQVLTVSTGAGEAIQVVCGAPNARAGMKGVFGGPGAFVPGSDLTLKVTAIRGVESHGMMCSVRELELGEEHDGIIALPDDAPVGTRYARYAGLDDPVIDVSVTPNRQDAMGVRGIARDLAAAGLGTLKPLEIPQIAGDFPCPVHVRTEDEDGCPAFYGRVVRGVNNGRSPDWLQRRLKAIGQRPISALVDITNYVSTGLGRPLHVYDLAKIAGGITARRARDGETVEALNGKTYALDSTMTAMADDRGADGIGGIMGGEPSSVTEGTTDILIECAWFTPERIALTGQKLGLTSDARQRFERGADPAFLEDGLQIATALVIDLAGGEPSQMVKAGSPPTPDKVVDYDPARCLALAGVDIPADRQQQILQRLGFTVARDDPWRVSVPSWRRDVDGPADLVEEVVRIEGMDRVPSTPLPRASGVAQPTATPAQLIERRAKRAAAARGLDEAITWSFISDAEAAPFGGAAWGLANPISEEMKAMRPSLLPGLLAAASRNQARGADRVALFEIGRRYLESGERPTLGIVLAGPRSRRDWRSGKAIAFDAYDAKAEALAILAAAGAPADNLQVLSDAAGVYHPGQSGRLGLGPKTILAEFGALHPRIARAFDLDGPVVAAELFLDAIPAKRGGGGQMRSAYAPPPLQAVTRDFAFIVPAALPGDQLLRAVRSADKATITGASIFDVFTGEGVGEGCKSVAIEVTLQPVGASFTDAALKDISDTIVGAAAKLGAVLRR